MDNYGANNNDEDDESGHNNISFHTNQVFGSRLELTSWVQTQARSLGYVTVTFRSSKNAAKEDCKVEIICDRGGNYDSKGISSSRNTGTIKMGCPFKVDGYLVRGGWRLYVIDERHTHPPSDVMEGHPFARRLTRPENVTLARLYRLRLRPKDIFSNLKKDFPENKSVIKDIYNAIAKIKRKEAKKVGKNPMQEMLQLLANKEFVYDYTVNGETLRCENLFFSHPTSILLLRAFPIVLFIDATYKTNIYDMPFVQIVGVTSTSKTFSVACSFVINEQHETYIWVLECLKKMLGKEMKVRVILTDRDQALVRACDIVFSDVAHQLCRCHIGENIKKRCQKTHKMDDKSLARVRHLWKKLYESRTEKEFDSRSESLEAEFPELFPYLEKTWLVLYKEKFVSCWVDKFPNFGNYTTNRAESEHALLKDHLHGISTIPRFVACIDDIVNSQLTAIRQSFETSRIKTQHHHKLYILNQLRGEVSHKALDLICKELQQCSKLVKKECGCKLLTSCGLPCACRLSTIQRCGQSIALDEIHAF